jgi:hypothetical protein
MTVHLCCILKISLDIQGGVVTCGLFFVDPLLLLFGAVSRKISENQWAAV